MPQAPEGENPLAEEAEQLGQSVRKFRQEQQSKEVQPQTGTARSLAVFTSLGLSFVGCVVAGIYGGLWLDHRLGTRYWVMIGMMVGLAAGVTSAWRLLRQFMV